VDLRYIFEKIRKSMEKTRAFSFKAPSQILKDTKSGSMGSKEFDAENTLIINKALRTQSNRFKKVLSERNA
jgi:hypothetical protein